MGRSISLKIDCSTDKDGEAIILFAFAGLRKFDYLLSKRFFLDAGFLGDARVHGKVTPSLGALRSLYTLLVVPCS